MPLWTLDTGLTYSAISLFLQCRHQFYLTYVEGWSPKTFSDAIEFGSMFHYFSEHMNFQDKERNQNTQLTKLKTAYKNNAGQKGTTKEFQELLDLAFITFRCYLKCQPNDQFNWISREVNFSVPYLVNHVSYIKKGTTSLDSYCTINLRGKRDGVFTYPGSSDLYLFETKTKSRIDEEGMLMSLGLNLQAMLYCIAAQLEYQKPIKGILYNTIRRPGQRLKKTETHQDFINRVEGEILADPKHYFYRQEISLYGDDLTNYNSQTLHPIILSIVEWYESISSHLKDPFRSPLHYVNPEALYNIYGRCSLFNMLTTGKSFGYIKRKYCFPELEG